MLRAYSAFIYLFLYAPIALIVVFSFNSGNNASDFQDFGVDWYFKAANNSLMLAALENSIIVAATASVLATIMGTMAAIALQNVRGPLRVIFDGLTYIAIMVPGIVIGIATLIALVTTFDAANTILAGIWPGDAPPKLSLGYGSIIAAHGLFSLALVTMIVKARVASLGRDIVEASSDLNATPLTTFRLIVLPQIMPSVLAGFLLAFTFSFDDFIIAFFVAGSKTTLPIYVFASIRRGVTPEINAIATSVLVASLFLIGLSRTLMREKAPRIADGE